MAVLSEARWVIGGDRIGQTDIGARTRRHSANARFREPGEQSMHEESTITAEIPLMGVFNDLVVFTQRVDGNDERPLNG